MTLWSYAQSVCFRLDQHGRFKTPCLTFLPLNITPANALSVGKYLLSPLIKLTESGQYAASVSVRSGRGSGTHDRIFRFTPFFATREEATLYALNQGRSFVRQAT